MDLLTLVISGIFFGPAVLFLAMAIRHFIPLIRKMKYPWWAPLLGPFIFLNPQYVPLDAAKHRAPFASYLAACVGWVLLLLLAFSLMGVTPEAK